MSAFAKCLEVYKCIALTVIAVFLAAIRLRSPANVTLGDVRAKKVDRDKIPVMYVSGGSLDVDNKVRVNVDNTVTVEGTVSVQR